ncbi:hypothetical protein [Microbulbifer sp. ALW1]|uniref:hypothetical protein n=1 Tax=Microbulbifer sp. (strain ALW1) TaxID=1516059 RepID=UPI0013576E59|nr:hypothetical protein [Microbulbifer sp. ALW1]
MASPKNQLLDNQFGIPPELFDALAGGARAKQEMGLVQGKYDQAQSDANAQLSGVQGRGMSATSPTIAQAIANIAQRSSGIQRMKNLEAQAKQLGGQISEGDIAKLGLQLRQKPQSSQGRYKYDRNVGTFDTWTGETDGSTARPEETPEEKRKRDLDSAVEKALAIDSAKRDRDLAAKQKQQTQAFNTYNTAISGLKGALAETAQGPIAGNFPAFTAKAQIAEGALSAMAPILKDLFRSAGEGVFTNDDQQRLMAMLPTRADQPSAAVAKLQNIDAIVKSKLGMNSPQQSTGGKSLEERAKKYGL